MKNEFGVKFIEVEILNENILALVDIGSGLTLVGNKFFEQFPYLRQNIKPIDEYGITVNNQKVNFYGSITLEIKLGNSVDPVSIEARVSDSLPYKLLLGVNFFESTDAIINLGTNIITIPWEQSLNVKEACIFPSCSNALSIKIDKESPKTTMGFIKLNEHLQYNCPNLLIDDIRVTFKPNQKESYVQLSNSGLENIILKECNLGKVTFYEEKHLLNAKGIYIEKYCSKVPLPFIEQRFQGENKIVKSNMTTRNEIIQTDSLILKDKHTQTDSAYGKGYIENSQFPF